MIQLENGYLVGKAFLKDAYEAIVDDNTVPVSGIHNIQPFYSNSIFFIGKMGPYEKMEESTYTPPKVEGYGQELHILAADDLPTENTASEIGGPFLPVAEFLDTVTLAIPTRRASLAKNGETLFLEARVNGSTIQANIEYDDESFLTTLQNSDIVLVAGEKPFVNKPARHIVFLKAKAEAVCL